MWDNTQYQGGAASSWLTHNMVLKTSMQQCASQTIT